MLFRGILYSAPQIFTNTVDIAITVTPPIKDCFFSLDSFHAAMGVFVVLGAVGSAVMLLFTEQLAAMGMPKASSRRIIVP